ncbi:MAG: hypothetical protein RL748_1747 [Pseudomonadota bacterium]
MALQTDNICLASDNKDELNEIIKPGIIRPLFGGQGTEQGACQANASQGPGKPVCKPHGRIQAAR